MSVKLITGYAGGGHITAADAGRFNAGICGMEKYVLDTGKKFAYSLESNNLIKVFSGDLVNQGRHISIPQNAVESITIENGTQNRTRIDVLTMRYAKDSSTGIESATLNLLKGTEVVSGGIPTPAAPTYGDIFCGDLIDDMPLYYITIEGLQVTNVKQVFMVMPSFASFLDRIYPIGSIYLSVNATDPSDLFGGKWEQIKDCFLFGAGAKKNGVTGGEETHVLALTEIPSHTHTGPSHTHTLADHTHTASTSSAGAHTHTVARNKNAAGGTARYAAQAADAGTTHGTSSNGAHTHTVTVKGSGKLTTAAAGTGATGAVGGGKSHNNMPPYLVVYIWKRIS